MPNSVTQPVSINKNVFRFDRIKVRLTMQLTSRFLVFEYSLDNDFEETFWSTTKSYAQICLSSGKAMIDVRGRKSILPQFVDS